tara:strand:+ start:143 stop:340 length:198 start_codon:yes stop_codon:yes gene_type:complete
LSGGSGIKTFLAGVALSEPVSLRNPREVPNFWTIPEAALAGGAGPVRSIALHLDFSLLTEDKIYG